MHEEFWHERWERNEIAFHQEDINAHLKRFWGRLGLPRGAQVFAPLCGKSRDMAWLAGQGYPVLGVELSPRAVAAFYQEHHWQPESWRQGDYQVWEAGGVRILCGDFFALQAEDLAGVAGVYDRASLIALPPAMRQAYARQLVAIVPEAAPILLVTLEYPQDAMRGPPFAVTEPEVRALYELSHTIELLFHHDALAENPRFQRRLSRLEEKVYLLRPLSPGLPAAGL